MKHEELGFEIIEGMKDSGRINWEQSEELEEMVFETSELIQDFVEFKSFSRVVGKAEIERESITRMTLKINDEVFAHSESDGGDKLVTINTSFTNEFFVEWLMEILNEEGIDFKEVTDV